jgi:hypothetical protein
MWEETTPRLGMPMLHAGQAQKEAFHNEALVLLDLAVQAVVLAAGIDAPPADPAPGDCWILGAAPSGAWLGRAQAVAGWTEGGWRFLDPREGMRVWVVAEGGFATFLDGEWQVGRSHGRVFVAGEQVVGPQAGAIADPAGGGTIDAEGRVVRLRGNQASSSEFALSVVTTKKGD